MVVVASRSFRRSSLWLQYSPKSACEIEKCRLLALTSHSLPAPRFGSRLPPFSLFFTAFTKSFFV